MTAKRLLVKRRGHLEEFDKKKVYASVYSAALNAHMGEQASEKLADQVMGLVMGSVSKNDSLTSEQIRDYIIQALGGQENDVAFLYEHHLDVN